MNIKALSILNYYDGPVQFFGDYKTEAMEYPVDAFGWMLDETETGERTFVVYMAKYNEDTEKRNFEEIGVFSESEIDWASARF